MEWMTEHKSGEIRLVGEPSPEALAARLGCYEELHRSLVAELLRTEEQLETLRAAEKTKSITFRQLLATKLTLSGLLARFRALGL